MNCREQAYDNAATMAGWQQRIKDINPNAEFLPCSNYSLNLVCAHAASVECEANDDQNYLQTEGLNIHQCAKKIRALQTVSEAKREEFVNDALIYANSLCEELEISFEPQDESGESIYLATGLQKYAFLWPEVILSMDELNLNPAPQDINKEEFQLQRVRLQAFVAATDPGCRKGLIRSGSGFIKIY
ncbi:uncharacterized protein TNCV_1220551 [Trichonephila clavipes]|nr:uncharacterized protein TNCV_1220551 [Trichonephila clavipes]